MERTGFADLPLHPGVAPKWLFERMVKLGREIINVIIEEWGPDEFIKRIADPVWFQSLGTVLAFDWNSSGLTTILTAALKEAVRDREKDLGIFICGGKGKTSRKTPTEIERWGRVLSLSKTGVDNLIYNSKMTAKVDGALVQDGFQIYHHSFFFSRDGAWTVVQQGMNINNQTARRYHWYSKKINDLVCEPHSGIVSQIKTPTLNLTARESKDNQKISTELVQGSYSGLMKDIEILRKHSSELSRMITLRFTPHHFYRPSSIRKPLTRKSGAGFKEKKATLLHLENKEFNWHPVLLENFSKSRYLEKILARVCQRKPENYEKLLSLEGVGPKTIRALSLVSEVIYGAKPSYEDPARYSFAHGGKDGTPYFVDRGTYDETINFFQRVVRKMKIPISEKNKIMIKLNKF